jgi:hypothetical protein
MGRFRASVAFASLVASVVMTAGVTAATSQAATAAPNVPYPPAAPALTVNRGSVRAGASVKATGNGFRPSERIYVTILYRPPLWGPATSVQSYDAHADKKGSFAIRVEMRLPGTAIILAQGVRSGKTASATVRVTSNGHGDGWTISPAGYTTPTGTNTTHTAPTVMLAGLGLLALAGSALITRGTIRRRRRVTANS